MSLLRDREAPSTKHKTRSRAHGGRASHVSFRGQKNSRFFRRNDDCVKRSKLDFQRNNVRITSELPNLSQKARRQARRKYCGDAAAVGRSGFGVQPEEKGQKTEGGDWKKRDQPGGAQFSTLWKSFSRFFHAMEK
jgi:hypothetical protein